MSTTTSGHLSGNGGVRGHSAGEFFPFMIMAQGTPDALRHYVIKPNGEKLGSGHINRANAFRVASFAYAMWVQL